MLVAGGVLGTGSAVASAASPVTSKPVFSEGSFTGVEVDLSTNNAIGLGVVVRGPTFDLPTAYPVDPILPPNPIRTKTVVTSLLQD